MRHRRDAFCSDRCGWVWAAAYVAASQGTVCAYCGHQYFEQEIDTCDKCSRNVETGEKEPDK